MIISLSIVFFAGLVSFISGVLYTKLLFGKPTVSVVLLGVGK